MIKPAIKLGLKHIKTKPYTPKTNGKAERFIQTSLREWAYARAYNSSDERTAELPRWLHSYNWHRPHGSIGSKPPISRLALNRNNLLRLHSYLSYVSQSIASVLKPAGLDKSKGLISALYVIDVNDPRWNDDPGLKEWQAFTAKFLSPTEYADIFGAYAIGAAATMVQVLKQCGDDLSRANIMRHATNITNFHAPMLMPGIAISTSPNNYNPIRQLQLGTFNGESWELFGDAEQRPIEATHRAFSPCGGMAKVWNDHRSALR